MTTIRKSRTFAVLLDMNGAGFYFIYKKSYVEDGMPKSALVYYTHEIKGTLSTDEMIDLMKKAGCTVRFFDKEEKKWMDTSTQFGTVPAPGHRDGSWTFPLLEEFDKEYLKVV